MQNLNEKQKETLENLQSFLEKSEINPNLPLVEELRAIRKSLEAIAQKEAPEPPKRPEVQKIKIEGLEVVTLKGDSLKYEDLTEVQKEELRGEEGKDYILTPADKKEIAKSITVPIVEKIIEKTEVIHEQPIVTNEVKEVAVAESGEQIVDKINEAEGLIKKERVEGMEEMNKDISNLKARPIGKGGGRKVTYIKRYNLSSQLDGVTKAFLLPPDTIEVVGVFGSQFPINFNPGTDWTFAGRTLTLGSNVGAPESGQALYCLIETLFFG